MKRFIHMLRKMIGIAISVWIGISLPASAASARDVTLAWDPSDDPSVNGYVVFWGDCSSDYPFSSIQRGEVVPAEVTTYTVSGLSDGLPYYFAVKAVNSGGHSSDFSDEAAIPRLTSLPNGFDLTLSPGECFPITGTAAARKTVEVWAGSRRLGATAADATGNWSLVSTDLATLGDGPLALTAVSTGASETVSGDLRSADAPPTGDLDYINGVDLADALIALKAVSGIPTPVTATQRAVTGDGRIGIPDAIFILQRISELRDI